MPAGNPRLHGETWLQERRRPRSRSWPERAGFGSVGLTSRPRRTPGSRRPRLRLHSCGARRRSTTADAGSGASTRGQLGLDHGLNTPSPRSIEPQSAPQAGHRSGRTSSRRPPRRLTATRARPAYRASEQRRGVIATARETARSQPKHDHSVERPATRSSPKVRIRCLLAGGSLLLTVARPTGPARARTRRERSIDRGRRGVCSHPGADTKRVNTPDIALLLRPLGNWKQKPGAYV